MTDNVVLYTTFGLTSDPTSWGAALGRTLLLRQETTLLYYNPTTILSRGDFDTTPRILRSYSGGSTPGLII
jgi:hypothetical protein